MQITVNVPDELADKVSQWEDGQDYDVTITQTGPEEFDLKSIGGDEGEGEEQPGKGQDDTPRDMMGEGQDRMSASTGSAYDTGGTTIPSKNPAVAALILTKRGKK